MPHPVHSEKADNPVQAAIRVTRRLLAEKAPRPGQTIFLKPNLVNGSPPPVTTDYRIVQGVVIALQEAGYTGIILVEGSGTGNTLENFKALGYDAIDVPKIDLDATPYRVCPVPSGAVWKEIYVPEILEEGFIISIPALKDHSMLGVTLSLKNLVGILPAERYSGYWTYKKSQIHRHSAHGCVADLIRVVRPAWAVVDGTIGMRESHIHGNPCVPPKKVVYGSCDSLEADRYGCTLLGHDWTDIPYLTRISSFWDA